MKKSIMKKLSIVLGLAIVVLISAHGLFAQQTFKTTIYFDYTTYLSNDGPVTSAAKDNFFAFRRAYFNYENKISDTLKFRFRYDADNTANITSVDFGKGSTKTDDKFRPFIKHLFLDYSGLLPNSSLKIGMAPTLTFEAAEARWGYRSVAKTLVDGFKDITRVDIDASSADIGVSLTGSMAKFARYGVMYYNGRGYGHAENDKYKKIAGNLQLIPVAGFSVVGYVDYEKQDADNSAMTYKVDGFIEMVRNLVLGAEYVVYKSDKNMTADETKYDVSGLSVFGRYAIKSDLSLFARFDSYEPNNKVGDNKQSLIIAGLDWAPVHSSMKLQPNVWFRSYESSELKSDVIFNMTFFLSF